MADRTATPLLSYYFVCARARASRERNERLRQEADRLDAVFKPVNMKRLEMLKVKKLTFFNIVLILN